MPIFPYRRGSPLLAVLQQIADAQDERIESRRSLDHCPDRVMVPALLLVEGTDPYADTNQLSFEILSIAHDDAFFQCNTCKLN